MKFKDRVKAFLGDIFDGIWCRICAVFKFIRKHLVSSSIAFVALAAVIVLLCVFVPKLQNAIDKNKQASADAVVVPSSSPVPTPIDTAEPSPTPEPTPSPVPLHLAKGDRNDIVLDIQQRLMELNYMDFDEPTDLFGPITSEAYKSFQRRNSLEINGEVDIDGYTLLMSSAAKTYMASIGDEGTDIKEIQSRLHELDYLELVTGTFGKDTEAAVKLFQQKNDLEVDGMVGSQTKECLYSEDAIAFSLYIGAVGEDVKQYQEKLYALGYLSTTPDGVYGRDTANAVKRFQARHDIVVDGHVGPATKAALNDPNAKYNMLEVTMGGNDVLRVQQRLKELNYLKNSDVTSYFGTMTEKAVKLFQKNNKLTQDGKVGRKTLTVLFSSKAIKSSTGPVSGGSGNGNGNGSGNGGGSTTDRINNFINIAKSKLGCPYVRGAKGPNSFDCSGFVYWCLNKAGVSQSYMTSYMWRTTTRYKRISSMSNIKKGDVIVYKMSQYSGHVAIAAGNGMMYDASSRNGKVVYRSYQTNYWHSTFYCAYRIFGD